MMLRKNFQLETAHRAVGLFKRELDRRRVARRANAFAKRAPRECRGPEFRIKRRRDTRRGKFEAVEIHRRDCGNEIFARQRRKCPRARDKVGSAVPARRARRFEYANELAELKIEGTRGALGTALPYPSR